MPLSIRNKARLIALIDFIFDRIPRKCPPPTALKNVRVVAHRGAHRSEGLNENTLPAFLRAIELGVYGIEFDVRWTRDDVPVIHHDPDLWHLFQAREHINQLSFSEIRNRFPEIPTLREVVESCAGRTHLFIELKFPMGGFTEAQKLRLIEELSCLKPIDDFHLMYIHEDTRQSFANWPASAWLPVAEFNASLVSQLGLQEKMAGVTAHYLLLSDTLIAPHLSCGQWVGTGFIDSQANLFREVNRGVNLIFTNQSHLILECIRKYTS